MKLLFKIIIIATLQLIIIHARKNTIKTSYGMDCNVTNEMGKHLICKKNSKKPLICHENICKYVSKIGKKCGGRHKWFHVCPEQSFCNLSLGNQNSTHIGICQVGTDNSTDTLLPTTSIDFTIPSQTVSTSLLDSLNITQNETMNSLNFTLNIADNSNNNTDSFTDVTTVLNTTNSDFSGSNVTFTDNNNTDNTNSLLTTIVPNTETPQTTEVLSTSTPTQLPEVKSPKVKNSMQQNDAFNIENNYAIQLFVLVILIIYI